MKISTRKLYENRLKAIFLEEVIKAFKKQMYSDYEGAGERAINEMIYLYEEQFGKVEDDI